MKKHAKAKMETKSHFVFPNHTPNPMFKIQTLRNGKWIDNADRSRLWPTMRAATRACEELASEGTLRALLRVVATEQNLAPCPFCGSMNLHREQNHICCDNCGTHGPVNEKPTDPFFMIEAAKAAWNRRAAL